MFFLDRSKSQVQALDAWREAERRVSDRWGLFAAEEAAAAELAMTADHQTPLSADRLVA